MLVKRLLACLALLAIALPLGAEEMAAATGTLSDADRATLVTMLEQGRTETEALVAKAEGDLFTTKPGPDRWSVAEVLEHIASGEAMLFGMVQGALAGEPDPEAAKIAEGMPVATFAERITDRTQRFQAPAELVPQGGKSREELLTSYRTSHQQVIDFVKSTDAAVGNYTAPGPAGKMTVHHLLTLIAAHNLRHNKQIAENLEQLAAAHAGHTN
jgi:uncharacterized damage-inducible protein DinB